MKSLLMLMLIKYLLGITCARCDPSCRWSNRPQNKLSFFCFLWARKHPLWDF